MNMRSYNIESDGQLFKMQQEALRRTYEAHQKALQNESARSSHGREGPSEQARESVQEQGRGRNRSDRKYSDSERQPPAFNRSKPPDPSRHEAHDHPTQTASEKPERERESLLGGLFSGVGGPIEEIKELLGRFISEPGKLLKDLPFLSKDGGIGKLIGAVRFDDLLLLGLLILLLHDDADWELLLIIGFLFIAGL